jgi:hypothetical protein
VGVQWTIGPEPAIVAQAKLGTYVELTRGEQVRMEFYFRDGVEGSGGTGATHGTVAGSSYGTRAGATFGGGTFLVGVDAYEELRKYTEHTEGVSVRPDINGAPTFRERTPAVDPVGTHLRLFNPGESADRHPALWGLITGGDDPNTVLGGSARLEVDVAILGDVEEYPTITAVRNALEA